MTQNRSLCKLTGIFVFFLFLFFSHRPAHADDCSLGRTPEGVYPMDDPGVVMLAEDVFVHVTNGTAACSFTFQNTGEGRDILMGFPRKLESNGDNAIPDNLTLLDFKAYVDGGEIPVQVEKGVRPRNVALPESAHYSEWYTFSVHLNAGEKKVVRNTYKFTKTFYSNGDVLAGYILRTGTYWKDPIGYARVTFDMGDIRPYEIKSLFPNTFRFENNTLVWERNSFEPAYDLTVLYNRRAFQPDFISLLDPVSRQQQLEQNQAYENMLLDIEKAAPDRLIELYADLVHRNLPVMAQYARSRLPPESIPTRKPAIKDILVEPHPADHSFRINGILEDPDADIIGVQLKISGSDPSQSPIAYEWEDLSGFSGFSGSFGFIADLLPGLTYKIEYTARDSMDLTDSGTLVYKVSPAAATAPGPGEDQKAPDLASVVPVSSATPESTSAPGAAASGNTSLQLLLNLLVVVLMLLAAALLSLIVTAILLLYKKRSHAKGTESQAD